MFRGGISRFDGGSLFWGIGLSRVVVGWGLHDAGLEVVADVVADLAILGVGELLESFSHLDRHGDGEGGVVFSSVVVACFHALKFLRHNKKSSFFIFFHKIA